MSTTASRAAIERARKAGHVAVGIPVDAGGGPTIDPTKNVLDLVEASIKRLDDIAHLRTELADEKVHRLEREAIWLEKIVTLRAEHQTTLRTVDQATARTETERASRAVDTLATQNQNAALTLRGAVDTSASQLALQLEQRFSAATERIAALEKSSYMGAGKQAVADPQMERLSQLVEALTHSRDTRDGKSEGISATVAMMITIIGLLLGLFYFANRSPAATVVTTPYTPAPYGTMLPAPSPPAVPR